MSQLNVMIPAYNNDTHHINIKNRQNDIWHNATGRYAGCRSFNCYAECHYFDCRFADCHGALQIACTLQMVTVSMRVNTKDERLVLTGTCLTVRIGNRQYYCLLNHTQIFFILAVNYRLSFVH